jgi:hypothetical protein
VGFSRSAAGPATSAAALEFLERAEIR